MPISLNELHSLYLNDELPFTGSWPEFLIALASSQGAMMFYDESSLPLTPVDSLSAASEALSWARLLDPNDALWAAMAIVSSSHDSDRSIKDVINAAVMERHTAENEALTLPIEVNDRIERLIKDNPALLARINLSVKNKLASYINELFLKATPDDVCDLLIFNKLKSLVYKPKPKTPMFKVGCIPAQALSVIDEAFPDGDVFEHKHGVKVYRCILNWIKNGISHEEMVSRALEIKADNK